MDKVGRPTDSEISRMEELVNTYFGGERWAIEAKFWDDGDVHLEAYSTIGTGFERDYPNNVSHHRQLIRYERESGKCTYLNRVTYTDRMRVRDLNRLELDW
jgi:hypothetical protein